ncbi:hypothetical protein [Psychrobacillus sp. FSL H8-0510]|uniref:hypothetical protein n=1 Tax=Psychrobacillus sp. FSL H8-0510 TaxID=2921394 RepID=UPI0030F7FFB9
MLQIVNALKRSEKMELALRKEMDIVPTQTIIIKKPFKYYFKSVCCMCEEKNRIVYLIRTDILGLRDAPFLTKDYCEKCSVKIKEELKKVEQYMKEERERKEKKEAEILRYEYLEREVERKELEEKAKKYGIVYPEPE